MECEQRVTDGFDGGRIRGAPFTSRRLVASKSM